MAIENTARVNAKSAAAVASELRPNFFVIPSASTNAANPAKNRSSVYCSVKEKLTAGCRERQRKATTLVRPSALLLRISHQSSRAPTVQKIHNDNRYALAASIASALWRLAGR